MTDSSHGSACLLPALDDAALLLKSLPTELPYRGCSSTRRIRGTARTAPASVLRLLAGSHSPTAERVRRVRLDLTGCSWAPIPAWFSAQRWLEAIPQAYELHYATRVAPAMPGNPISLAAVLVVARARAAYADFATGRNCRPSVATLMGKTGLSERTVQRASKTLLLLGMATEVARGRQRTLEERYASWRVGDKARGWTSVWALHECRYRTPLSPHLAGSLLRAKPQVSTSLTTRPRRQAVTETAAARRHDEGSRLAREWILAEDSPSWAKRYRTPQAWASNLQTVAKHGWSARDLNALIRDFAGARWLAPNPHKPIALLGAILKWHGDPRVRPAAADEAREAQELAAVRARLADDDNERKHNQAKREQGIAALVGPGRAEAMRLAAEATRRSLQRRTQQVAREVAAVDAAIRAARQISPPDRA